MTSIQSPKGTFDILPASIAKTVWQSSSCWSSVEAILRDYCARWGVEELRMPIFEATELFSKSTGDSTDIVQKEMYTFNDKGNRSMSLRPEGTPGALRALIEASAFQQSPMQKVFYMGPMFRYERPQQGRYRQFHQFGVEVLGPRTPWLDSEVISLGWNIFKALGLTDVELCINTLASEKTRESYRQTLKTYLEQYRTELSEDSQRRLEQNPLRILDSKDPKDALIVANAPLLIEMLDDDSRLFFDGVLELLEKASIPYRLDNKLVRGLDYYCDTVFEFQTKSLGAQSAIGGGGRYARMVADMGGPQIEGVGFAIGMERLLQAVLASGNWSPSKVTCQCLLVAIGDKSAKALFALADQIRKSGGLIQTWPHAEAKKLKNALSYADKIGAIRVAVMGEEELQSGVIRVKNMQTREEEIMSLLDFARLF